ATRPFAPAAQQAFGRAQSTVSRLPSSNCVQVRPPFLLKSLPERPTTIAVLPLTHVAPERYTEGAPVSRSQVAPPSRVLAKLLGDAVGALKSPPTARPCRWLLNASALMPADGPLFSGVAATVHVRPRLRDVKTRA